MAAKALNYNECITRAFLLSIEERWISAEKAVGLMLHCLQLNSNIQTFR